MSEHEDWVRFRAYELAQQRKKYASTEDLIEEATKISAFIMGKPKAEILKLANLKPKEKEIEP